MRASQQQTDQFHKIIGVAGRFIVTARGDQLVVRLGRQVIRFREIEGLADFVACNKGRLLLELLPNAHGGLHLVMANESGFGWSECLGDPDLSTWGTSQ